MKDKMSLRSDQEDAILAQLEEKVARLEKLASSTRKIENDTPIIEKLLAANNVINATANRGNNIKTIFKRSAEVNRLVADGVVGNLTLEFDRQLNLVLSLSDQYKSNGQLLERVANLHSAIDKGNLKCLDELRPDLLEVLREYSLLREQYEGTNPTENLQDTWQKVAYEMILSLGSASNALAEVEKARQPKS